MKPHFLSRLGLPALLGLGLASTAFAQDGAMGDLHAGHDMAMPAVPDSGRPVTHDMNGSAASGDDHGAHAGHGAQAPAASPGSAGTPAATPAPSSAPDAAQAQGLDTEPSPHDAHTGTHESHGDDGFLWFRADQFEALDTGDDPAQRWRASLSWGNSLERVWLASEGERQEDRSHELDTRLFLSHAVAPFWNATVGLRETHGAGNAQSWVGIGLQGLAPYWFETSATLYAGEGGQTALRLEADYELLLSNRLILQPELELNLYGRDDAAREQGAGLADSRAGLRLRYEVTRQFAPYVGIEWTQSYGDTRDRVTAAGERAHDRRAVAGVRFWY